MCVCTQASGKSIPYEMCDPRPGDVPAFWAACEKAERDLGWRARLSLHDMCKCVTVHTVVLAQAIGQNKNMLPQSNLEDQDRSGP